MKAMIFSDLITSKNAFVQLLLISIVICGFLAWGTGEVIVGTAAMATMAPLMYLFSIFAYDEMNGWERFRMTLPLTKQQVAYGRYVSMLIVSVVSMLAAWLISFVFIAIIQAWGGFGTSAEFAAPESPLAVLDCGIAGFVFILLLAALTLPLLMRFGMNKATRLLPLLVAIGNVSDGIDMVAVRTFLNDHTVAIAIGGCVVSVVLYVVSAFIAARLYQAREL